jgi:hypothetical protein
MRNEKECETKQVVLPETRRKLAEQFWCRFFCQSSNKIKEAQTGHLAAVLRMVRYRHESWTLRLSSVQWDRKDSDVREDIPVRGVDGLDVSDGLDSDVDCVPVPVHYIDVNLNPFIP